jgi:hypothetical protein
VFIRLQLYKELLFKWKGKNKLTPKFYGPYKINKKISQVAYTLELSNQIYMHNVFHVSCLKKVLGQLEQVQTKLPILYEEGRLILDPEGILTTKERNNFF